MSKDVMLVQGLFADITRLIEEAKHRTAISVNFELSMLYWSIGRRIQTKILNTERAAYGDKTIIELSQKLTQEYGKGWSDKQLRHCLRTAETFQNKENFCSLSRKLTWTHIRTLIYKVKREEVED